MATKSKIQTLDEGTIRVWVSGTELTVSALVTDPDTGMTTYQRSYNITDLSPALRGFLESVQHAATEQLIADWQTGLPPQ